MFKNIANNCLYKLDDVVRIDKLLYIGPVINPLTNDFYNNDLKHIFKTDRIDLNNTNKIELVNQTTYELNLHNEIYPDNNCLNLTDFKFNDNESIFYFCNIECDEDKNAYFILSGKGRFYGSGRFKIWLNGVLVFCGRLLPSNMQIIYTNLNIGNNQIIIEQLNIATLLGIRICDEKNNREINYIKNYLNTKIIKNFYIIKQSMILDPDSLNHTFMVKQRDFVTLRNDYKVLIKVKKESGDILDTIESKTGEIIEYNVEKLIDKIKDDYVLIFEILVELESHIFRINDYLALKKTPPDISLLEIEYNNLKKRFDLSDEEELNILVRLKRLSKWYDFYNIPEYKTLPMEMKLFKEYTAAYIEEKNTLLLIFSAINKNQHFNDLILSCKINNVYFYSKLDNNVEKYDIRVPENYDNTKKYPVIFIIPTEYYDNLTYLIYDNSISLEEDAIIVASTIKGVTLGSYIGEAIFFEIFYKIKEKFNIDEERIYLAGYCNGGYSVIELARNFPHLFAAISPIIGQPRKLDYSNLLNLPVLLVNEFSEFQKKNNNELKKYLKDNFEYLFLKKANHFSPAALLYSTELFNWMLKYKRVKYPEKIFYRSIKSIHNCCYWLKVLKIDELKKDYEIEGKIISDQEIKIHQKNVIKLQIFLPENYNKENFIIRINKNIIKFENYKYNGSILINHEKNIYKISDELNDSDLSDSFFGTGILSIYLKELKVVIPSNFKSTEEENIIKKVAINISKPKSTGWISKINIKYPIITEKEILNKESNSNLIFIGNFLDTKIRSIFNSTKLQINDDGYYYQGKFFKCDYCIMFISKNPVNADYEILRIFSNKIELYLQNNFLINLEIPSYLNGVHPFLNKNILIYKKNGFVSLD